MKKISKCKLTDGGKEIGNILLLSTSKSNGKILATHIFKASDELVSTIDILVSESRRERRGCRSRSRDSGTRRRAGVHRGGCPLALERLSSFLFAATVLGFLALRFLALRRQI